MLYARDSVDALQLELAEQAQRRFGESANFDSVSLVGARSMRIEQPRLALHPTESVSIHLEGPEALLSLDAAALMDGRAVPGKVQLKRARIVVHVRAANSEQPVDQVLKTFLTSLHEFQLPFDISGADCELVIRLDSSDETFVFEDVQLVFRSVGEEGFVARVASVFDEGASALVRARRQGGGPAEVLLACEGVPAKRLRALVPREHAGKLGGVIDLTLDARSSSEHSAEGWVEVAAAGLPLQTFPIELPSSSADLRAHLQLDLASNSLSASAGEVVSGELSASWSGDVLLSSQKVDGNLHLVMDDPPIAWIEERLREEAASHRVHKGEVEYSLVECRELSFAGEADDGQFTYAVEADGLEADVAYQPADPHLPRVEAKLKAPRALWSSTDGFEADLLVRDGIVRHPQTGLRIERVNGVARFQGEEVFLDSATARLHAAPWALSGSYHLSEGSGQCEVSGVVPALEETPLAQAIQHTDLSGRASLTASATYDGSRVVFEGAVDASQTEILYRTWFLKPPGIGASGSVSGWFEPKGHSELEAQIESAAAAGSASLRFAHDGTKWRIRGMEAFFDRADPMIIGKCLRLPYVFTGSDVRDVQYSWTRDAGQDDDGGMYWHAESTAHVDIFSMRAVEAQTRMVVRNAVVQTQFANAPGGNTGFVDLKANSASMPALGETWFVKVDFPPELRERFPLKERALTYALSCDELTVPPWNGTGFQGRAYFNEEALGVSEFSANVGDGRISGSYDKDRDANAYRAMFDWAGVPAHYFLEHMDLPELLTGTTTGTVSYSRDNDDPSTLNGQSRFAVTHGLFSADFILHELGQQMGEEQAPLPPHLHFERLEVQADFSNDRVATPDVSLISEGLTMNAEGAFVTGGDLDYEVRVSIDPETAARVPALRDNLNLEGHRLAQQDVQLAFHLSGPMIKPRGRLAEAPPVSVTLVTGGLEVVNEAVRVIDTPRKVLMDLLKIGGGIVGAGRAPESGESQ
jgi:hypothetical protein